MLFLDSHVATSVRNALRGLSVNDFLDVGCGVGFLSNLLHDIFPSANGIGIDASKELIQAAKKQAAPGVDYRGTRGRP
jgi:2-polyprenyl-3-methyl-5-hydroxy-6-metoxy-1,4-benzoquinol methylase